VASTSCCATALRSDARRARWPLHHLALALLCLAAGTAPAADASCPAGRGPLRLAVEDLRAAHARASGDVDRARSAAALGAAWLKLNRLDEAEPLLRQAAAGALPARARAAALMDLGNLQLARGQRAEAAASWSAAAELAPEDAELALSAELNRLRLRPAAERAPALQAALPRAATLPDATARARLALHIAAQAQDGTDSELAWRAYEQGRQQALAARDDRLAAEAHEGLAALYEAQQRPEEALRLVEQGIAHARRADARERLMTLEGRAGRLALALGQPERALAAYRRAVEHVEAVRSDIPVQYQDGRSSFRDTLEPLYLGLTDLLLRRSDASPPAERQALLRQARDTVELIKQTELADYLRDRCSVDAATRSVAAAPPAGTAIYYPIILPDRLELLLETAAGLERRSVAVGGERLRDEVQAFVAALRNGQPLRARSEALYRTLIAPLDALLAAQRIHTLVAVPDGVLRLLPLASLHDGRGWLLQRLAVATVPGLSLTAPARGDRRTLQALLAGLSEPGPVVDKLSQDVIDAVLEPGGDAQQPRAAGSRGPAAPDPQRASALREALALPGVRQEIETLAGVLPGTVLLDGGFTLDALKAQMRERAHPIVHIASHGVFGHDADSTFIMTYDELLTLDGLQALLRDGRPRGAPVELLTLSACQTAEGDDRAPLGMSGSALKARARSALGTLWPVSDASAQRVMGGFYRRLAAGGLSRVEALRQAQLELLQQPQRGHPFHWAPFILIGDWQ
jgi:CHAT domain-containing protein